MRNSKLKYLNKIILDEFNFSGFSSVEYEFGIKLALVSISHVTLLYNQKEQLFCFI